MSKERRPRKRSPRRRPKKPIEDSAQNFEDPNASFTAWLLERFTLDGLKTDAQHRATALWWSDLLTSEDDRDLSHPRLYYPAGRKPSGRVRSLFKQVSIDNQIRLTAEPVAKFALPCSPVLRFSQ
jgi:hypothetical protein